MFKLTFTNSRGQGIELFGAPFRLSRVEGLGDVETINHTQKAPYQDGVTHIDTYLAERYITIGLTIYGSDPEDLSRKRTQLTSIFSPKLGGGTLKYINGSIEREITAVSDGLPSFPDGGNNRTMTTQKVILSLLCPDPYWRDATETAQQFVTFTGGLKFPLKLPTIFGNQDPSDRSKILTNYGDSPSPMEVVFAGPATSPIRIENETTGKFIEVAQNLLAGEKLVISTVFGKKKVEKIAEDGTVTNAYNYIKISPDPESSSTFFQIEPGNNLLTYSTGIPFERATVTVKFYSRYLAI